MRGAQIAIRWTATRQKTVSTKGEYANDCEAFALKARRHKPGSCAMKVDVLT